MLSKQVIPLDIVHTTRNSLQILSTKLSISLANSAKHHSIDLKQFLYILFSLKKQLNSFKIYHFSIPQHMLHDFNTPIQNQDNLKDELLKFTTLLINELTFIQQEKDSELVRTKLQNIIIILSSFLHEQQLNKNNQKLLYSNTIDIQKICTLPRIEKLFKNFLVEIKNRTIELLNDLEYIYINDLELIHSFTKNYLESITNTSKQLLLYFNQNRFEFHFKLHFLSFKDKRIRTYITPPFLQLPQTMSTLNFLNEVLYPLSEDEKSIIKFYSSTPTHNTYRQQANLIIFTNDNLQKQIYHASQHIYSLLKELFLEHYPSHSSKISPDDFLTTPLVKHISASPDLYDLDNLPSYDLLKQSITKKILHLLILTPNSLRYKRRMSTLLQIIDKLMCKITLEKKNELIDSMHKNAKNFLLDIQFTELQTKALPSFVNDITLFLTNINIKQPKATKIARHIVSQIRESVRSPEYILDRPQAIYTSCLSIINNELITYQKYMIAHAIYYGLIHYSMLGKIIKIYRKDHNDSQELISSNIHDLEHKKRINTTISFLIQQKLVPKSIPFETFNTNTDLISRIDNCTHQLTIIDQALKNYTKTDYRNTLLIFQFLRNHLQEVSRSEIKSLVKASKYSFAETSKIYNNFITFNNRFDTIPLDKSLKKSLYDKFQKSKQIKKQLNHLSLLNK